MSNFVGNMNTYNICTENEISVILSHFHPEYVFDIIRNNIANRFKYSQLSMPNIVGSFEQYFKQLKTTYVENQDAIKEIEDKRLEIYREILSILCSEFRIRFNYNDIQDLYSAAYYMYSFLVSDFNNNLISFFTNFIIKERNGIYDSLNLAELKKNKDNSTIYMKKIYKNTKLAIINSNLDLVIDNICAYNIDLSILLNNIYADKNIVKFLECAIIPVDDFFKSIYIPVIQSPLKPMLLTDIRMDIQKQSLSEDIDILNLK